MVHQKKKTQNTRYRLDVQEYAYNIFSTPKPTIRGFILIQPFPKFDVESNVCSHKIVFVFFVKGSQKLNLRLEYSIN